MSVSKFKNFKKSNISDELIQAYKSVFDAYPELSAIPVYAWGRYYKYELAGDPFEVYSDERGFSHFKKLISHPTHDLQTGEYLVNGPLIQWDIIKIIDNEHNIPGGKIWTGEWGDYLPDREEVAKAFNFDNRGGRCLVILKINNEFEVKEFSCDSPE